MFDMALDVGVQTKSGRKCKILHEKHREQRLFLVGSLILCSELHKKMKG